MEIGTALWPACLLMGPGAEGQPGINEPGPCPGNFCHQLALLHCQGWERVLLVGGRDGDVLGLLRG